MSSIHNAHAPKVVNHDYITSGVSELPKFGHIGHRYGKSKISCSVHFDTVSRNTRPIDLKKSQICPIWCQSGPILPGLDI